MINRGRILLAYGRECNWKYIMPAPRGDAVLKNTNTETANAKVPQLYDLSADLGETKKFAVAEPTRTAAMAEKLAEIQKAGRTRPCGAVGGGWGIGVAVCSGVAGSVRLMRAGCISPRAVARKRSVDSSHMTPFGFLR
jgi:hypothetical protein